MDLKQCNFQKVMVVIGNIKKGTKDPDNDCDNQIKSLTFLRPPAYPLGWSEKPKSLKSKNGQADYLPCHSPDVRTVFEI